jgi:Putative zinc-finger
MRCESVSELAPEVALGIATGEQRAQVLGHLAECAACRRQVGELSEVADELLMLAPAQEPPAGFESRVLDRIDAPPVQRRRRARRFALRIAAPLAAALATAAVMFAVFNDDRDLANSYRDTLAEADGKYFQAGRLEGPGGVPAGVVFGYQGRPSWVMVIVDPSHRDARYTGELVTNGGRRLPLPGFRLDPVTGSWGRAIPMDLHAVASVRLVDRQRGETLEAALR